MRLRIVEINLDENLTRPKKISPPPNSPPPLFCRSPPPLFCRSAKKNFFRQFSLECRRASAAPSTASSEYVLTRKPSKNRFLGRFWVDFGSFPVRQLGREGNNFCSEFQKCSVELSIHVKGGTPVPPVGSRNLKIVKIRKSWVQEISRSEIF